MLSLATAVVSNDSTGDGAGVVSWSFNVANADLQALNNGAITQTYTVALTDGKGSIVNISSLAGMKGAAGAFAYGTSKWAVRGLTRAAAMEFGPRGVRVNAVLPGGVYTAMGNPNGLSVEQINRGYTNVPLQRVGMPAEIAQASDDGGVVRRALVEDAFKVPQRCRGFGSRQVPSADGTR